LIHQKRNNMCSKSCPTTVMVGPDSVLTCLYFVYAMTEGLEDNIVVGLTGTTGKGKGTGIEENSR
jgi:V8-like Glu-specific endopeptidase